MCRTTDRAPKTAAKKNLIEIKPKISFQSYLDKVYDKVRPTLGPDLDFDHDQHGGPDTGKSRTRLSISIFLRSNPPGTAHEYAGKFDDREHFSGSLIKVAAMFAAFKLRAEARALSTDVANGAVTGVTQANFFSKLEPRLNLEKAVPIIKNTANINKKPAYAQVLQVNGGLQVDFAPSFYNGLATDHGFFTAFKQILATLPTDANGRPIQNAASRTAFGKIGHMYRMIVPSDDCSAGECISRLSYPYINVKLMEKVGIVVQEDGFYKPDPDPTKFKGKGIWLGGDYIENWCPAAIVAKRQPYVRIDTENDCDQTVHPPFCGSAQNTTSKQMSRFFLKIITRELVDPISSDDMRGLLHEAEHEGDISFLDQAPGRSTGAIPPQFDIDGAKIGQAPIKPDPDRGSTAQNPLEVRSEGMIIKWKLSDPAIKKGFDDLKLNGEVAVCWQNLTNHVNTDGLIDLLNKSISGFVKQVPLTSPELG